MRSIWRSSCDRRDVAAEAHARRVVGDRPGTSGRARARPAPSPRSCSCRRRRRCGSAARRGCPSARRARAARRWRRPRARRGSRAARARCRRGRAARRPPPRWRRCGVSPSASSSTPYSDTCRPRRTAARRRASLCCLEPVKCWSRLPNCSGATMRRSTFIPVYVVRRAPAGPTPEAAGDRRQRGGGVRQRLGIVCGGDEVEVLDAVRPAPRRTRELDPVGRGVVAQRRQERLRDRERAGEHGPLLAATSPASTAARPSRMFVSAFGPKPFTPRSRSPSAAAPQRLQRVDPELVVEEARALGAQAGQARDREEPGGELRAELLRRRDGPGLHQALDLLLKGLADARQLRGPPLPGEPGHRHRGFAHRLGRVAVGDDSVDDRPVELVEVSQLVERERRFRHSWGLPRL